MFTYTSYLLSHLPPINWPILAIELLLATGVALLVVGLVRDAIKKIWGGR
jgi:hypothetical protein